MSNMQERVFINCKAQKTLFSVTVVKSGITAVLLIKMDIQKNDIVTIIKWTFPLLDFHCNEDIFLKYLKLTSR